MEFSEKQRLVLSWWCDASPYRDMDAILCDGAVRSGKSFCLGLSFFCWAMRRFRGQRFAVCARTVEAARRNIVQQVRPALERAGFTVTERLGRHEVAVRGGGRENTFCLFGGKDESSAALIQGLTLAGALLDEAALMPRSFVEQTVARCSAEGAKVWMSCNPESKEHWLYRRWISRAEEMKLLRVHFTMADNPALSGKVRERYERYFQGSFYRRFVLGEWVGAQGRVYDFFDERMVRPVPEGPFDQWRVSCDYGTVNPTSMGLWGEKDGVWYRVDEFYYDARKAGRQKTDREYVRDLEALAAGRPVRRVVVDPSAASFMAALREEGWPVQAGENDVLTGIRVTADLLRREKLVICTPCRDAVREFSLYCWDERSRGDRVVKRFDHAMDDIRYFAMSVGRGESWAGASWVERRGW